MNKFVFTTTIITHVWKVRNNPCPLGDGGVDNIEPLTSVIILSVDDEAYLSYFVPLN